MSLKWIGRFLIFFILFICIYLFCSFILPKIKVNTEYKQASTGVEIFIKSNGVHTDFVVPVKTSEMNWYNHFPASTFESVDTNYQYISMGWGDKGFFLNTPTWADLKFSTAFKAAFFLSSTAMHVTYIRNKPDTNELCKKIVLSQSEYKILVDYIKSSFETLKNKPQLINHVGYSEQDNFYEANGTYSFLKTCNVWTGQGLKKVGVKIGIWTPFHRSIIEEL